MISLVLSFETHVALEGVPKSGEQTFFFWIPHLGPAIEIQRGQMMSENPPAMHGALVQSRSSKDGSRWKQMEAMGGRPFEIL